jgi:hypothetical protein
MLRTIFRLKRQAVTGDWRKLRNDELRNFYASKKKRLIKSISARQPEGKRSMGRPRHGMYLATHTVPHKNSTVTRQIQSTVNAGLIYSYDP